MNENEKNKQNKKRINKIIKIMNDKKKMSIFAS